MRLSASPFRNQDLSVPARPLGAGKPGLHIVQFKDVITDAAWDAMREAGAEVDSYLPDFAFLVRMTPEQAAKLARNPLVRDVTRFRPEWKVSPGLLKGSGKAQLRVSTFAGQESAVAQGAQALGVRAAQAGPGVVQVEADRSQVLALAQDENVTFVDEVRPIRPTNDVARGLIRAQGDGSPWANGLTGAGQVVAVADTGLDTGNATTLHPDLRNRLQTAIAIGRTGDWSDPWGHGTHVAGSILGNGAASGGQFKGVAPDARLVMQSMNTAEGGLTLPSGGLPTLFSQANSYGARIHTNSWGVPVQYGGWVYDTLAQQVDQYTWSNKGFTVLFAAGNDGFYGINTVTTPATAKNAISVGASENLRPYDPWGDNPNDIAAFSSRGNTPDGRVKPDVVAPGTWILSTRSSLAPDGEFWANYNQYYGYMGGTSMATPITAGSSALVRQFYMTKKGITPSASLIKATLINGAQDMGYGWMSPEQGWGRIDLTTSLFPTDWRYNWFDNESTPIATGGVKTYTFHADAGQMLKFSLVWTDSPGAPLAAKELVNDLDLEVTAPDNTIYKGNCFSNNTASSACTGYDRLNNVENVYFAAPADGYYTVKVKGYNVPVGPQPFSLVASGAYLFNGPDSAPPTVSITAPANNSLVSGTVDVRASASDDKLLTKVEFYLDGALQSDDTTAPYTWNWDAAGTPGGTHALVAKAYDAVGKVTTSAPVTVAIDTQAPVVNITTPANNGAVRGTATVTANALDDIRVAKVEFYVDDGAQPAYTDTAAPYSWSWVTTGLPGGSTHTLRAKAYDSAGNVAASPDVTVVVDNQAPTVALTGLTANAVLKGTVEVGANAADNLGVAKVEFYVDGVVKSTATTAPYTWSWDTATATNAAHSVTARAYDQAGNVATTLPVAVTVDNAPPALTSMIPADGASLRGTVTVTAGVSDNRGVTRVEFYLDEAAQPAVVDTAAPYSWTWNTATAGNGSHRITVKAYDAAGNMVSRALTVTADNTAPTVSITAPANQAALPAGTATVTADAADNAGVAKVDFFLDGILKSTDTAAPFAWDWNTAGVIAGSHTLKVAASDAAGNKTDSAPVTITLDNLRPAVSISSPSASANLRGAVSVKANATDNRGVTKVEFYLDGALQSTDETGPAPYTWNWDTTQAANSTHALAAKAYDAVGNVTDSLAVSVKVDNEVPSVSISSPAADAIVRGTVAVNAGAADNMGLTKVEFYLDNGAQPAYTDTAAPYTWSWVTTGLAGGSTHTLRAKTYDTAGNVAASPDVTVVVDNQVPTVALTGPKANALLKGAVEVGANAADNLGVTKVEFYVDGALKSTATTAPYTWSWDTSTATNAAHSVMAKAYDQAGNVAPTPAMAVTVDNAPPALTSITPADGASLRGTVTVTAGVSDNRGVTRVEFYLDEAAQPAVVDTASPYSWTWNTATAGNGSHRITVKAYDAAGNMVSRALTVTADNTAPTVSITAPANQAALPAGTVTVTADAADNAGVAKVDFFLDGILKSTDTAAPFAWDWNTAGVIAGSHTLKVAASDAAGNKTDSAPVAITLDNLRPAVSISSPSASANLRGAVTVKASATDNRGVTKVEFYLDGALQGTDETGPAPYTWDWDTTQAENGTHALAAKAYDAVGNVTATLAVSVKVDNEAPSVSINTPANGGAVRGTVNVTANAADNIGVTKVAFYLDNGAQPAYTDTAAPYSWSWGTTTLVTGSTHTVIARAYDASGNVAASGPVTVTVDNVLPNLTVTVPRTGNYVRGTVTVSATASDTVALDRVEFYVDSVKNESLTGGPFDWNWDTHGVADGSRSLMVKAYDTAGNVRIVTTSVTVDNTAPTVSIAAPGNGAPVKGTVAVNASASGAVKVEFYLDDQRVYTDTVSPWSWGWNTTAGANGAHTLKVIGYDAAGNSASATVEVTVSN